MGRESVGKSFTAPAGKNVGPRSDLEELPVQTKDRKTESVWNGPLRGGSVGLCVLNQCVSPWDELRVQVPGV